MSVSDLRYNVLNPPSSFAVNINFNCRWRMDNDRGFSVHCVFLLFITAGIFHGELLQDSAYSEPISSEESVVPCDCSGPVECLKPVKISKALMRARAEKNGNTFRDEKVI